MPRRAIAAGGTDFFGFAHTVALKNDGTQTVTIDYDSMHTRQQTGVAGVDIGWLEGREWLKKITPSPVTVATMPLLRRRGL